jgi:hypothetical protein
MTLFPVKFAEHGRYRFLSNNNEGHYTRNTPPFPEIIEKPQMAFPQTAKIRISHYFTNNYGFQHPD